jgi:DNA polymerase iota
MLYQFVMSLIFGSPVERLGLEELRIDLTDIVEYNLQALNRSGTLAVLKSTLEIDNNLEGFQLYLSLDSSSFFYVKIFSSIPGKLFPLDHGNSLPSFIEDDTMLRIDIGAHLANHIIDRILLERVINVRLEWQKIKRLPK